MIVHPASAASSAFVLEVSQTFLTDIHLVLGHQIRFLPEPHDAGHANAVYTRMY